MGACEISTLQEIKRHGDQEHHRGSHNRDQKLVQERTVALVLLRAGEQAFVFFSQGHNGCQAQYKKCQCQECFEAAAPAPLAVVAVYTKSLKLLSTSRLSEDS